MSSSEWKEVAISEVCDIIGGGTPKTSMTEYWNGDIPWLSVIDINNNNRHVFTTEKRITKKGLENSSTKLLNPGDIIISARGTVGALAQLAVPMAFNQSCYGLEAKGTAINDFLYYGIKNIISQIKAKTHGSVFDTITRSTFNNLSIILPTLDEQKAIAATLSCLDDKIELNNRINKTLEEMAQAIFKSWFVDFEPFQDGEFEDSELGKIPKGWRVITLGEIDDFISISTNSINPQHLRNELIEYYSFPAYDTKKYPSFEKASTIKSNKYQINDRCILVSKLNPNVKRYWNPICLTEMAVSSTEFIVYQCIDSLYKGYFYYLLESDVFYKKLTASVTGSTNSRQRVKPKDTLNFKFVFPPISQIREFSEIINPFLKVTHIKMTENYRLASIRDTLLPKLMSGEIRVPIEEVE